jgi:hypothetical protein
MKRTPKRVPFEGRKVDEVQIDFLANQVNLNSTWMPLEKRWNMVLLAQIGNLRYKQIITVN